MNEKEILLDQVTWNWAERIRSKQDPIERALNENGIILLTHMWLRCVSCGAKWSPILPGADANWNKCPHCPAIHEEQQGPRAA